MFLLILSYFSSALLHTGVAAESFSEKLLGKWNAVTVISSGMETSIPGPRTRKFQLSLSKETFEGLEQKANDERVTSFKGRLVLDVNGSIAKIDLVLGEKPEERIVGIFRFENERLIICLDSQTGRLKRPEKFESLDRSGNDLIIFERMKDEALR